MRVVLDMRCVHPGMTGIGRYAANLCLSLERLGTEMELAAIATPAGAPYLSSMTSIRLILDGSPDPAWSDMILPDVLREARAEIFHSPLFVLPSVRVCDYLCTIHDAVPLVRPDLTPPPFAEFFRMNAPRAVRTASHVVTVSEHARQDLIRHQSLAPERVTAIHEPVSPIFKPRPEAPRDFLLYVGALDRRKNLALLVEAYALLRRQLPSAPPLVIVGGPSGDGFDVERVVSQFDLRSHVQLLGRVPDDQLAQLYASASVFVFPSLYEGFGLPVVEAMASGTPVVASNASAIPEIAGDAALLVDPQDPRGLCDSIARVLGDPALRAELVRKGLERASKFSLENQGSQLLELYKRILGR